MEKVVSLVAQGRGAVIRIGVALLHESDVSFCQPCRIIRILIRAYPLSESRFVWSDDGVWTRAMLSSFRQGKFLFLSVRPSIGEQ